MEKCKFCQQELAEDSTVCPHCGKDNAETAETREPEETVLEETKEDTASGIVETTAEETQPAPAAEEKKEAAEASDAEEPKEAEASEKVEEQEAPAEAEKPSEEEKAEKPEEKKKATPGQMAGGILMIVVLAAILIALIISALGQKQPTAQAETTAPAAAETQTVTEPVPETTVPATIPADGNPNDATCKGTYTADAEAVKAAASDVIATMGEYKLTNGELQVYYWKGIQSFMQANPYAAYMVDMNKPLDVQPCVVAENMTWQQYFLSNALLSWQNYQSMAAEADANHLSENPEAVKFVNELPGQIEEEAKQYGFENGAVMLAADVGPGATIADYVNFAKVFHRGYGFYEYFLSVAQPDDAALETYFKEHQAELEEGGVNKDNKSVNVRHILITPEDAEADESWKEAGKKAQDLLKTYEDGEKTEESFGALATEHSQDPGSQATGGLYENVMQGQMVPEFDQWCFDAGRKIGDTGIVKTTYGYHIMFYAGDQLLWKDQVSQIYLSEKTEELIQKNAATYPLNVDYSKIVLGLPVMPEQPAEQATKQPTEQSAQ